MSRVKKKCSLGGHSEGVGSLFCALVMLFIISHQMCATVQAGSRKVCSKSPLGQDIACKLYEV